MGLSEGIRPCPSCGQPLYGWLQIDTPAGPSLLERCENCRLGIAAELQPTDVSRELLAEARNIEGGKLELRLANRDSIQSRLGGLNWAALEAGRGLYPTPESLRRLAEGAGLSLLRVDYQRWGRSQIWMWQTIVNAFTFNQNFATKVRAGVMRPLGFGERLKYVVDAIVTVLATPLVVVVSIPLELVAALTGRGGVFVAVAAQSSEEYSKVDQ